MPAGPDEQRALQERILREQLALVVRQLRRLPVPYILIDGFILWLLVRLGLTAAGLAWFAVATALQLWRWRLARDPRSADCADPAVRLRRLSALFVALGAWRALLVPLVFSQPFSVEHYVFTMTCLGIAAGGTATAGGAVRTYAAWAAMVGGGLVMGWLLHGDWHDVAIAVLIVALMGTLWLNTRDHAATFCKQIALAYQNENLAASLRAERDRAQALARSLAEERDRVDAISHAKTRFFAAASHDLRQPLHALSINATTLGLLCKRQADPLMKELSQGINRALHQSNSLLDGILDISRLDADIVRPHFAGIDVRSFLEGVRDEFAGVAAQRGLKLTVDAPGTAPLLARSDFDQLTRILNNLVSNALKFTAAGSVTLRARPAPSGDAAGVVVTVADTGPGIKPCDQERVFEEFYQTDNPSRDRAQGLGLGLSIVKRTADLLEIEVRLVSAVGAGTSVELRLPAAEPSTAPAPPDERQPEAEPRLDLQVLAIDDEPDILVSLRTLLEQLGCRVRCVADAEQALGVLDEGFCPDVILADHRLERQTGVQAIGALRAHLRQHVPAVIVTGDTAPATMQLAAAGGDPVIHKPVDGRRLAQALGAAVASEAARQAARMSNAG